VEKKLIPYNIYLYSEHVEKLKKLAGQRKASSLVRDAVSMMLDGKDEYSAGYNRALKDVAEIINKCKDIEVIAIRGKYLADVLIDQIEALENVQ
jgi:bisphosphoglycerate-independent phosphoglycerate mutase (AlkP superfamily)